MPVRVWLIFGSIVFARLAFGVQMMSVGAVGPDLMTAFDLGYAALGTLVGVYSLPGAAVALPGGWLAATFGDRRMLLVGLGLMTGGGAAMAVAAGYPMLLAGRVVSGTGYCLLQVVQTKLVLDYVPRERLTNLMGTYIAGYALGCALGPSVLPLLGGWQMAMAASAGLAAVALIASAAMVPAKGGSEAAPGNFRLMPGTLGRLMLATAMWSLSNVAYMVVFNFAPTFFTGRGLPLAQASGLSSLGLYVSMALTPLGGWVLSRTLGLERGTIGALFGVAALIAILPIADPVPVLVAIGALVGLGAGPAFTIATRDLAPEERALAMAVLFTVFNLAMAVGPPVAGFAQDLSRQPEMPFFVAALYMVVAALAQLAHVLWPRKEAQA
jgi:predicted MFS family arabinose efflux permease